MVDQQGARRRTVGRPRRGLAIVASSVLLLAVMACGDDDGGGSASSGADEPPANAADLLGPEDSASGEPVRIGMVGDGQAPALDTRDEFRSAEATVEFWNERRAGIGGRPIELVTCETAADPARGTDCGNRMVEEDVVAVVMTASSVTESVWEPLHQAGVPVMVHTSGTGEAMLADAESTFSLLNPLTVQFGLPVSVAKEAEADSIAWVVIDVPAALVQFESGVAERVLDSAGLDYELVRVPPGTADMTSQMREIVDSGARVVNVVGNDTFCIAAFQGLAAAGYDGDISTISYCVTDATREAIPADQLEGMYVLAPMALGATGDPTYELYLAVMDAYGDDVEDVETGVAMSGYTVVGALATALEGTTGDITAESVIETVKAMPEQELPGGGGATFQCGGSATPAFPAACTNQWLQATLDADGQPTNFEVVDSSDIAEAL
jgi:branched-chain amino acid transport system substrate-binding protein